MPETLQLDRIVPSKMKQALWAMLTATIACFFFLTLAGCNREEQPSHLIDENGTLRGVLEIAPYPPVPMQDTTLNLSISDAGRPLQGAKVELTLTMPGCTMAPSFGEAVEISAGEYQVQTVLTMAGAWQVDTKVSIQDQSEDLTFFFATK
jgi:hypothetical protein